MCIVSKYILTKLSVDSVLLGKKLYLTHSMTSVKDNSFEGDIGRTRNYYIKYTEGHNYAKTGGNINVPFICISSNNASCLYEVS